MRQVLALGEMRRSLLVLLTLLILVNGVAQPDVRAAGRPAAARATPPCQNLAPGVPVCSGDPQLSGRTKQSCSHGTGPLAPCSPVPRLPIIGAWNLDTPSQIPAAARLGIRQAFLYGMPPTQASPLGRALSAHHMTVISGGLIDLIRDYECHRTWTVALPPTGSPNSYCASDFDPTMTAKKMLATTHAFVQQERTNPLIQGYWVLDDVPPWDAGSLRHILQQIHRQIRAIAPHRLAICGFGVGLRPGGGNDWLHAYAANFSPQGCDMVGLYVYAGAVPVGSPVNIDSFDWPMSTLLPAVFQSLKAYGWNIDRTPLIGIGQAWGGWFQADMTSTIMTPTDYDMEQQGAAFCQTGATGIAWYAWDLSVFLSPTTPANNSELASGVKRAIAACKQQWVKL